MTVGFTGVAEDEFVEVCSSVLGLLANTGYDRFDEREDDVDRLRLLRGGCCCETSINGVRKLLVLHEDQQFRLRRGVQVQRADRDVRSVGDLLRGHACDAVLCEQRAGSLHNPVAFVGLGPLPAPLWARTRFHVDLP